jgi:hypothetical protein
VSEGGVSVEWRWCWCLCRCSDRVGGREAGLEGEVAREEMAHVKKARSSNLVGASRRLEQGEQCAGSSQEIQQMTREGAGDALEAGAGRSDGGDGEGATLRRFVEMGTLACRGHVHVAQTRITATAAADDARQDNMSHGREPQRRVQGIRPLLSASAMAQDQSAALDRVRDYVTGAQELHDSPLDLDASDTEARLTETVQELQSRIQEQQAALDKVRRRQAAAVQEHPLKLDSSARSRMSLLKPPSMRPLTPAKGCSSCASSKTPTKDSRLLRRFSLPRVPSYLRF